MPTYLINLDQMFKFTKIVNEEGHRGVYWDAYDRFIVESPAVTTRGESMGFTWRTEIMKADLAEYIQMKSPAISSESAGEIIRIFERIFLSVFTKVYGEYNPQLEQLGDGVQYLMPPE